MLKVVGPSDQVTRPKHVDPLDANMSLISVY